MGLKSGSRDAGLDDEDTDVDTEAEASTGTATDTSRGNSRDVDRSSAPEEPRGDSSHDQTESTDDTSSSSQRPTMESIPYKLRRDKVNEGREQVPFFLRDEVMDAEDDLQTALEEDLGEEVYKSDYREAAMVAAQQNPMLIAEILREWGYDLETT